MHAMRQRCTPHLKDFDRTEGAQIFLQFGCPGAYPAFLHSREYPATKINMTINPNPLDTHEQQELFSNSQAEEMETGNDDSTVANTRVSELSI